MTRHQHDSCKTNERNTMRRLKSPIIAAIASAAVTASVVGGVAIAQTTTPALINACVAQNSGNARIVSSTSECTPNERLVTWNQKGEKGDPGPAGPAGPAATEIADGTIETTDLKAGAVTADKVKANVVAGFNQGGTLITTTTAGSAVEGQAVSAPFTPDGADHRLLVLAQVQLACNCGTTPSNRIILKWQLFEGTVSISQEYSGIIHQNDPIAMATVSALVPNAGPATDRTYSLKVTAWSEVDGATTVTSTGGTLNVLDLGR